MEVCGTSSMAMESPPSPVDFHSQRCSGTTTSSSHATSTKLPLTLSGLLRLRETSNRRSSYGYGHPLLRQACGSAAASSAPSSMLRKSIEHAAEAIMVGSQPAAYCPFSPEPRSTIAADFSPDGKWVASTHGDHTVKISCCHTGKGVTVLQGHRRTPWVVRFHPKDSTTLASGSLDQEVRLWNLPSGTCTATLPLGRPIASLAFHAQGKVLAVASGHKLFIWRYEEPAGSDAAKPVIVLKTRRSLRAVQFHPHGAPLLLTAEVNDPDVQRDMPWTPATTNAAPAVAAAAAATAAATTTTSMVTDEQQNNDTSWESAYRAAATAWAAANMQENPAANPQAALPPPGRRHPPPAFAGDHHASYGLMHGTPSSSSSASAADTEDGVRRALHDGGYPAPPVDVPLPPGAGAAAGSRHEQQEQPCLTRLRLWRFDPFLPAHQLGQYGLNADRCALDVPHAVLCSEMGAHFAPDGRTLAACIACVAPPASQDGDPASVLRGVAGDDDDDDDIAEVEVNANGQGARVYELRLIALAGAELGNVLASCPVRAAHCLTSIQMSPTGRHLVLAYGRRHLSLLRSLAASNQRVVGVHCVLELYELDDQGNGEPPRLVRMVASAVDEVNVAAWHPHAGGGLAYGTKEGRLRLLGIDSNLPPTLEDRLLAAEAYA